MEVVETVEGVEGYIIAALPPKPSGIVEGCLPSTPSTTRPAGRFFIATLRYSRPILGDHRGVPKPCGSLPREERTNRWHLRRGIWCIRCLCVFCQLKTIVVQRRLGRSAALALDPWRGWLGLQYTMCWVVCCGDVVFDHCATTSHTIAPTVAG